MSDGAVELIPTRDMGRARRNLLFAAALLFILAVANPDTVGIPGFGDEKIDGGLAQIFVLIALILFSWEYSNEYRLTIIHNNVLFVGSADDSINRALGLFIAEMDAQFEKMRILTDEIHDQIEKSVRRRPTRISTFEKTERVSNIKAALRSLDEQKRVTDAERELGISLEDQFVNLIRNSDSQIDHLQMTAQSKIEGIPFLRKSIDQVASRSMYLEGSLFEISSRVHRFQRNAMLFKDLLAPGCFATASLLMAGARLVERANTSRLGFPVWSVWLAGILGVVLFFAYFCAYRLHMKRQIENADVVHVGTYHHDR